MSAPESPPALPDKHQITVWLTQWQQGDAAAFDKLFSSLYGNLRILAQRAMRNEVPGHTLQPTALVHEVYNRLVGVNVEWADRSHFLAVSAQAMRRVLIDHARRKQSEKRGSGAEHVTLDELRAPGVAETADILELHEAMIRLGEQDPRKERAIEMHYFGGLSHPEIAQALNVSPATVDRDLRMARAWLCTQLQDS